MKGKLRTDTSPTQPRFDVLVLSEFLPYRISVVAECISATFADRYQSQFGLSVPEWRVMAILGEHSPRSTQDVIVETEMDRVRVSRAVIRLSDKGLIVREARANDQRAQLLQLSRKGAATYRQIVPLAIRLQSDLAAALTKDEIRIFEDVLEKLYRGATKIKAVHQSESLKGKAAKRQRTRRSGAD